VHSLAGRRWLLPLAAITILALGATAWYLASPLFIRTTLVEKPPFEIGPRAGNATASPRPASTAVAEAAGSEAAVAQVLASGDFSDRDNVHRGRGQALVARAPGGDLLLRFENFSVTNGPDLHVLLSTAERPTTHDEVYDGVYVGKLKASEGAFHYELPPGTDLQGLRSVVVYCVPFRTIFTSAPLAGA
jgi:hypothetical protein